LDSEKLKSRTKVFAHRCIKLATAPPRTPLGRHIESQLIRCSTSVASNYRASLQAQSKAAFIAKISIVIEESDESEFWLEFIIDEQLMSKNQVVSLLKEAHELTSIFITTRKTAQKKIGNRQSTIINPKAIINRKSTIQGRSKVRKEIINDQGINSRGFACGAGIPDAHIGF
jgi:four helix bundle protein